MEQKYKNLLIKLVKEKRFPLRYEVTTAEERRLILEIMQQYKEEEIIQIMEEAKKLYR